MDPNVRNGDLNSVALAHLGRCCTLHPMPRTPNIPVELTKRPFSLEEARSAGLTLSSLKGKAWRRLGAGLYCWHGLNASIRGRCSTAWRDSLPADAVFAGTTAAWILGLDFAPTDPVDIIVPTGSATAIAHPACACAGANFHVTSRYGPRAAQRPRYVGRCSICASMDSRLRPWSRSTWRSIWGSQARRRWQPTREMARGGQEPAACDRSPRSRPPPNRRWRLGFAGS